ncbi:restriction endonuclease subunit S [Limosilactobacillus reuteri]|uniref:restriction endonuclease subunit S n=1 Tax=Limosilactobacillus reuteri TaxID=1598 RepID=UPI00298D4827|nr:restriction endonuclease subunit S [Limosilactobacillus reuteri]
MNVKWEQRKLGENTMLITKGTTPYDKSNKGPINFIKVENIKNNTISPSMHITEIENDSHLSRSKLKENDILFSIAGTLGRTAIVTSNILPANTNQALAIIRGYNFNQQFLINYLSGRAVKNFIRQNPTIGAQPNLSLKQIKSFTITAPNNDYEQIKIGSLIKKLNNLVTLQQRKLKQLKQLKKAMLQQLFVDKNCKQPILRFKNFNDNWEERKLSDIANYRNGKAHEQYIDMNGIYTVVNSKFISTNGKVKKFSNKPIELLKKGEIAFVLSDVPNGKALAKTYLIDSDNKYSLNQRIAGITPSSDINSYFLYILMNRNRYFLKFDDGVGQTNLSKKDIEKFKENYPLFDEQQKIANLFSKIQTLITRQQNKLNQLIALKKYLLQNLFI